MRHQSTNARSLAEARRDKLLWQRKYTQLSGGKRIWENFLLRARIESKNHANPRDQTGLQGATSIRLHLALQLVPSHLLHPSAAFLLKQELLNSSYW